MVSSKIPSIVAICSLFSADAFITPSSQNGVSATMKSLSMVMEKANSSHEGDVSRRVAFKKVATTFASIASVTLSNPDFALAAKTPPTEDELNRIKVGYERMSYLLENFEQETTVCRVRVWISSILLNILLTL